MTSLAEATRYRQDARNTGEAQLVARAQAGDGKAFDQLADRYSSRLRRVLYRITRDCEAAKDAVQEALVRAWQGIARFEGRSRFFTWLTRIGVNEAYRGMHRRPEELTLDDPRHAVGERASTTGSEPEELFESREFLGALAAALEELPPDYRAAVRLRDVEGFSTREAAELLGVGERALKSRLHRGRMALRARLDGQFAEAES